MSDLIEQTDRLTSAKGDVVLTWPRPDVIIIKVTGHFDRQLGNFILDSTTRTLQTAKRIAIFCDWSETTGYDSDVRVSFTHWASTHRSNAKFHLLVNSKIVSMGVSVANLALGGLLTVYSNRPAFDAALRSAKMGMAGR